MPDSHVIDCNQRTPLYKGVLYLPKSHGTGVLVALFTLSEEYELPFAGLHQTQKHLR